MKLPTPSSFLSHHSLLIKWKTSRQSGKFPLVALKGSIEVTTGAPMITVDFPPSARATFVSPLTTASVLIDVILIRHTDARREHVKNKETIASHVPFAFGGVGARLGIPQEGTLKLGTYGSITIEYSAVKDGSSAKSDGAGRNVIGRGEVAASQSPGGLIDVSVPEDGDVFSTADGVLMTGIARTPGVGSITNLYTVVNEGLFRSLICENPPDSAASVLFFSSAGRTVWDAFHVLREDDTPPFGPWLATAERKCVYRTNRPSLRYGKSGKKLPAIEQSYVSRVDGEYVSRTIVYSEEVPVVGSGVKLDLVFHVAPDGAGGCVVAVFVHVTASDMAKRLAGGTISKYSQKILSKAHEAIGGLLAVRRLQGRERDRVSYRNLKFRNSLVLGNAASISNVDGSLDPSLWRRIVSTDTLPNRDAVYQYLTRLLTIKVLRVTEGQVQALESVIVYHRESIPIVSAACNLLIVLCKASSFAVVHKFSPTLWSTLESVFALHKPGSFSKYQELLANMSRLQRLLLREKEELIARESNTWSLVDGMMGNVTLLNRCFKAILEKAGQLTCSNVMALTKAVTLHLQNEEIVRSALQIIVKSSSSIPLLPASTVTALLVGAQNHHLENEFVSVLSYLRKRNESLSHFEKYFGSLGERFIFRCNAWLTSPSIASIQLYLTANFLILGSFVLPIDSIRRAVQYRSMTLREGIRIIMSANYDDYYVVLSKRRELLTLLDKRRVTIEPPLKGYN